MILIMAKLSIRFVVTTMAYLNICILPLSSDWVNTRYLFNVKPMMNVKGASMISVATGAVIIPGGKDKGISCWWST